MRRLLIRPGGIGDCILSLPALEALRADYTEVWVARPNIPLIRFADRVVALSDTGIDWLEIDPHRAPPSLLPTLASFDSIVSWYGANRAEFRQVVYALGLPFVFFAPLPTDARCHATEFYLHQVESLGAQPRSAVPRIPCIPQPDPDQPYIVIHPFSGSPKKNWPLARYRDLAERLRKRWIVQWVAGPEEPLPEARRFEDLYELGCWLAGARLFIGNDSGIAHLAAAVGTPTVVLFGPTDPAVWAPRGDHVHIVRTSQPGMPMEALEVDEVFDAVVKVLDR